MKKDLHLCPKVKCPMNILVILRNIYSNPDLFDDEQYLCKSDCNVLAEAMMLKELFTGQVTALLFAETIRTYFPDYDLILFGRLAYDGDAVSISTRYPVISAFPESFTVRKSMPKTRFSMPENIFHLPKRPSTA